MGKILFCLVIENVYVTDYYMVNLLFKILWWWHCYCFYILVLWLQGLKETKHPYCFVARQGFKELLEVPDAGPKVFPVLIKLVPPLRAALVGQILLVYYSPYSSSFWNTPTQSWHFKVLYHVYYWCNLHCGCIFVWLLFLLSFEIWQLSLE